MARTPRTRPRWTAALQVLLATTAMAAPSASTPDSGACGLVAPAVKSVNILGITVSALPAKLALNCLKSVPVKTDDATKLVASLKAFTSWQSTLAWLKTPPSTYTMPATDVMGSLDAVAAGVTSGKYASEYDLQADVIRIFASAHDGHFGFRGDVFKAFAFRIPALLDVVSVSANGTEVPKLYQWSKLQNATAGSMPPAIVQINGEDAAKVFMRNQMVWGGSQDEDANWNSDVRTYANPTAFSYTAGSLTDLGEHATVTYDNGQTEVMDVMAIVKRGVNMTGIQTGTDFYNKFCNATAAAMAFNAAADPGTGSGPGGPPQPPPPVPPSIEGYPMPIIRDNAANQTSGYFLNGSGYDDVAVLSLLGFSSSDGVDQLTYLTNFQQVIRKFLAACKAANKKRLVIDLTNNGGGAVLGGYELYRQLFPGAPLNQSHNTRAAPSVVDVARTAYDHLDEWMSFDPSAPIPNDPAAIAKAQALYAFQSSSIIEDLTPGDLFTPAGVNMTTEDQILAPVSLHGDTFVAYEQLPLDEPDRLFNLTGTGNLMDPPPAVFDPANIVLLTDGQCASTCTLFSYLMIFGQKVKTVAVGGRPMPGPMQSIGGVEGAQIFYWDEISAIATATIALAPDLTGADPDLKTLDEGYAIFRSANPQQAGAVNGKNAFGPLDNQTPLQFLYQAANCRFFWTKDMVFNPDATWKRAVDATWTNPAQFCVEGSRVPLNMTTSGKTAVTFTRDMAVALGQ